MEREEEEMENNSANDMFFHYLGKAYRSFMSGDDAYYDSLEQGLATDMSRCSLYRLRNIVVEDG